MVFYRKYRPQTIEELDSKVVRDKLITILLRPSSFHALLFTGPKGLGKTSAARIVAKVVNCERINQRPKTKSQRQITEPCNKCLQCTSITNGTNIDVLEIDGASNRGIDEIRDLREKIKLSSASALKKVYIIDEVHMLTTEAFNALLKTLEEPPAHVIFILCTTEPHKVPQTIVSRCFHIAFKKATAEELVRAFLRISKKEKIRIDKEALFKISEFSDGSFRDGVKILEEISSGAGNKKITKEMVEKMHQATNIDYQIGAMIKFLSKKNVKEAMLLVGKITTAGVDMKYFLEKLMFKLHELLLIKVGVSKEKSDMDILSIEDIKGLMDLLTKAYSRLKYSVLPQLPLEIAIIEWSVTQGQDRETGPVSLHPHPTSSLDKLPAGARWGSPALATRQPVENSSKSNNIWQELIDKVKSQNHSIAGVLRGCSLKSYDGKKFVIEAKFKFHKEKLEDRKTRELIEGVLKEMGRNKVNISIVLKENPKH